VKDVNEFLVELPFQEGLGRVDRRVTYQDSCHLAHAQRITAAPRKLLKAVPGLELVEMQNADRCCGSAGIYNLTQREMSLRLLSDKMKAVAATGSAIVTATGLRSNSGGSGPDAGTVPCCGAGQGLCG
jgi:glycolate oxidase iron-sulfur subunit